MQHIEARIFATRPELADIATKLVAPAMQKME
jgi:hypothetical protein